MKKFTIALFVLFLSAGSLVAQLTPDILYYNFNGTGTNVPNLATAPPTGATTATLMGGDSQGGAGQCGGAIIGTGNSSSTDYLATGWQTTLSGSWTISFWSSNITSSSTLFYIFGDPNASSLRCFTNGVAGANNWILRGPVTDVTIAGGATVAPHVNTFVYDAVAGNIYAYLDGVLVNTVAQSTISVTSTGTFKLGYGSNVELPSGGLMDEFRFYGRALSASEVAQLVNLATKDSTAVTSCDSYLAPSGKNFTSSGIDTVVFQNISGCDSTVITNITINNSTSGDTIATACDNFTWYGTTYTSSGTPTYVLTNVTGCDSTVTLHLTLNANTGDTTATVCGSFTWYGTPYTSSATPTYVFTNAAGCDSTVTLHLTVNPLPAIAITGMDTINQGSADTLTATGGVSYVWTSGSTSDTTMVSPASTATYTVTGTDGNGCIDTASFKVVVNITTAISTISNVNSVSVYPNPVVNTLNLEFNVKTATQGKIEITDATGRVITSTEQTLNNGKRVQVEVSNLASGMYFVKVIANNQSQVIKFMKQ